MTLLKKLTIGTTMAALAFAGATGVQAQPMGNGTMMPPMPGGPMMPPPRGKKMPKPGNAMMAPGGAMMSPDMASPMMAPTLVSGTVTRYYIDRGGYVSAMDVQTADGVRMVRFAPSMAQRVTSIYPVGSTASVYVTSRMMGSMTSYDLAGVGPDMPTPSQMMMPTDIDAIDVLKSQPYIRIGAKQKTYIGNLTGYIADPMSGDVLAIVLDKDTLVRIPMQNRLVQASTNPSGITPLFKNASVVVKGYDEAPIYGVVTPFAKRVAATGISVNGRTLGPLGFGKMMTNRKPLLGFDLNFLGGMAPDQLNAQAGQMGYMSYDMSSTMPGDMANGGMNNGAMMNGAGTMNNTMMGTQ